ncbi:MAG: hypothetical protein ACLURP_17115 [Ruminococcus sp.]
MTPTYSATNFAETSDLPENHAHNQLGNSLMQECEDIKRQLPISSYLRPAWDVEELGKTGMEQISIDLGLSRRVYKEKDEFYKSNSDVCHCSKESIKAERMLHDMRIE